MAECIRKECYWWQSGDFLDNVLEWFGDDAAALATFEEWLRKHGKDMGSPSD